MATWPTSVATDAILYIAVNNLQTTLSGSIDNVVTTITLASSTGFPVAGGVTIDTEVIFYTGISGAQLTGCTRGADGTTAASHSSGVPVGATVIAAHHNLLKNEVIAIESSLNFTASRAIASNSSGRLVVSSVTDTELSYLSGVTSAIQTQINGKVSSASPTFTGQVFLPDGTISLPGLAFSGDTNTGLYRIGADDIALVTGGVSALEINSSQLLGMGTTPIAGFGLTIQDVSGNYALQIRESASKYIQMGAGNPEISSHGASFLVRTLDSFGFQLKIDVSGVNATALDILNTGAVAVKGSTTNDSAGTGIVGEYIEGLVTSDTNFPTTNTYGDATSISLTAGDWDVSGMTYSHGNGATVTRNNTGISSHSGNDSTGLVFGVNTFDGGIAVGGVTGGSAFVPVYRISLATTTTIYLKVLSVFTTATPQYNCRLSARRVR